MNELRLHDLIFFTDRDLAKREFPGILLDAGLQIKIHDDHFNDTTPDEEWLTWVGEKGWFAITRNKGIRYKPIECDAVMYAGVGLFVMRGKWSHKELARGFLANMNNIERFLQKYEPPFIANVYNPTQSKPYGRVSMWLSYDEWKERYHTP
jgi:hypothetical protein